MRGEHRITIAPDEDDRPIPGLEGIDPLSERVFRSFMRTLRLHGHLMMRILADEGAHPGQAICLRILAHRDGISQRDLAEAMHLSRPTVTAMLQRLEKSGAVTRRVDQLDQRVTRVHLTEAGHSLETHIRSTLAAYSARVLDPIAPPDRIELERLLGLMADNIAAALDEREDDARAGERSIGHRAVPSGTRLRPAPGTSRGAGPATRGAGPATRSRTDGVSGSASR